MSLNSKFITLLIASSLFGTGISSAAPVRSGSPSIMINADEYTSLPNQTADLSGHVKIVRDGEVLTCDRAHVNKATGDVIAEGNITFVTAKEFISAEKMTYNFITKKGTITHGLIQNGQETIEGGEIIREGDDQYLAHDATYTSCVNCPPSWKVSGSKIDASVGGYAYISQPLFRLYNVPVLWLPWIAIPIKNQRQSGLLPPSIISGGNSGKGFGESYFFAFNKSQDATLGLTYFDRRGFKQNLEYRFVSDANSKGTFEGHYLFNDNYFFKIGAEDNAYSVLDPRPSYISPTRTPTNDYTRYGFRYNHHVELPNNFTGNINLNVVRDIRYVYDFPDDMPGAGDPALENRINFSKSTENTISSLDIDVYQNLLLPDPLAQNTDSVHRMPEIKYSLVPMKVVGKSYFGFDFDYVNFMSSGKTFYDPNGSLSFVGDGIQHSLYRTGQRFIFHPYIYYPINLGDVVELLPQIEYQENLYQFGYSSHPTTSTGYLRASLDAKTRLSAIYGGDAPTDTKIKHEMIPELLYSFVPDHILGFHTYYQDVNPAFFGTNNQLFQPSYNTTQGITEFDNIQFDYEDRVADRNVITAAFTNKFIRKRTDGVNSDYKEIILHRISQSFDFFNNAQPETDSSGRKIIKVPWSAINSLLEVKFDHFFIGSDLSYYPYNAATTSTTTVGLNDDRGDAISVGYAQGFQISPNYTDPTNLPLTFSAPSRLVTLGLKFSTTYVDLDNTLAYDTINSRVSSFSTVGLLKPPGKCWGFAFTWRQVFGAPYPSFNFSIPIYFGEGRSFDMSKGG